MKTVIIIPARLQSSRFPCKPLARATGKTLVQHVYETARESKLADGVFVASGDLDIVREVDAFGGRSIFIAGEHPSGTSRVAAAAKYLSRVGTLRGRLLSPESVVVNLQVDEPLVPVEHIDTLIRRLWGHKAGQPGIATLAATHGPDGWERDPNTVGVAIGSSGLASHFTRKPYPFALPHLGIYAYRKSALEEIAALKPSESSIVESLEQLTWLENKIPVAVYTVPEFPLSINTKQDYAKFVEISGVGQAQPC